MVCDVALESNARVNYPNAHSPAIMEPRALLAALMARNGENPNSLSAKLNNKVTQPQLHRFVRGTSKEPRRSTLQPVAEHYDVPLDAFYDPTIAEQVARRLRLDEFATAGSFIVEEPGSDYLLKRTDDYVIPQYSAGGSMGAGLLLRDQPGMISSWHVTPEWVQKNVPNITSHKNLAIVTGFGDSMRPLYNPGDPLIVDTGVKSVEFDGIYFFRIEAEGFIKRLQRIPGVGLRAISENKAYEAWDITKSMDFEVFARVVKIWRSDEF